MVLETPEWKFKSNKLEMSHFEGHLGQMFCPMWVKNGKKMIIFKNFSLVSPKVLKLIVNNFLLTKTLFKEFFMWAFGAKMWVHVGSKMV